MERRQGRPLALFSPRIERQAALQEALKQQGTVSTPKPKAQRVLGRPGLPPFRYSRTEGKKSVTYEIHTEGSSNRVTVYQVQGEGRKARTLRKVKDPLVAAQIAREAFE